MLLRKMLKLKQALERLELDIQEWRDHWGPTKSSSKSIERCSKCQGFGHAMSDCPNKEFDGSPSMNNIHGSQGSPRGSNFMTKVQEISMGMQELHFDSTGFTSRIRPGFVHLIAWPSRGYNGAAGSWGLSSRCELSNKTNCKSFGGHLTPQIS